ncbi:DUF4040 domain-containing protein [Aminithiophilus ramosus]|uniref:DUF4040 domain-containing protein n=2 Tax=Synergistales TaxID=649776 RepID=A0A9Q7EW17_9BACT|nr:DUF4040 domain-containing protein [Aminithiophilus ramosus]QTX31330.1 DUF4040 domain-containing protein [Aminithiophilus ramosus]QVL35129.1 DUF4040 domain-containing protein [Synergistota bacterium]
MNVFPAGFLLFLVLVCGLFALLSSRPLRSVQALAASGLCLALVFAVLRAPAVALGQLLFGVTFPALLYLFVFRACRKGRDLRCRRR